MSYKSSSVSESSPSTSYSAASTSDEGGSFGALSLSTAANISNFLDHIELNESFGLFLFELPDVVVDPARSFTIITLQGKILL